MDAGGDEPNGYIHPFVAEKRQELQARLEKRIRKLSKSNPEESPLLTRDETLGDIADRGIDNGHALDVSDLPSQSAAPVSNISSLAESVK